MVVWAFFLSRLSAISLPFLPLCPSTQNLTLLFSSSSFQVWAGYIGAQRIDCYLAVGHDDILEQMVLGLYTYTPVSSVVWRQSIWPLNLFWAPFLQLSSVVIKFYAELYFFLNSSWVISQMPSVLVLIDFRPILPVLFILYRFLFVLFY